MSEFSVLVDRSVAGSSILDGQIELMLHRYTAFDIQLICETSLLSSKCIPNHYPFSEKEL